MLFSAHAAENGLLWRGLARAQAEGLEEMVSQRLSIERNALEEAIKCKILQCCKAEILTEVDQKLLAQKEWV